MKTYTAYLRSDAKTATRDFVAATPEHALKKARRFYKARAHQLLFVPYDNSAPVSEIAIWSYQGDDLAVWYDDDLRLRLAQLICSLPPNWWLPVGKEAISPRRSVDCLLPSRKQKEVPHERPRASQLPRLAGGLRRVCRPGHSAIPPRRLRPCRTHIKRDPFRPSVARRRHRIRRNAR